MSVRTYKIFSIKNIKTNEYYLGCTSVDFNHIRYLIREYKKDNTKYTKFGKSFEKYGYSSFIENIFKREYLDKSNCLKQIFNLQKKIGLDKTLNDSYTCYKQIMCPGCQKKIYEDFLEKHQELYCSSKAFSEIDNLLDSELEFI